MSHFRQQHPLLQERLYWRESDVVSKFGHYPHQVLTNAFMSGDGTLYPKIDPATLTLSGKQYH